ncbi:hypothetical protein D9V28_10460 [Mycetocola zhadangensis]|uniref:Rhamnosyltransferase n=1 Tax=Mycetocola zhadangensis TaxID=1164595 RepID=A0A3L7J282_9MICO|nr:hypothetical protein D9V28_10460 [Mycetocola zhadangensis]
MPDIDHVLLTRFNVPSPGSERFIRTKPGWLEQRSLLFEQYCLPSVQHQTVKNLHWIIYFDPESPEWFKERVHQWSATGDFIPIYRSSVSREELIADLRSTVGRNRSQRLLTTNLDNDDGLATDFAARLQHAAAHPRRTALYLSDGLIMARDRAYRRVDRDNAFCSVIESWQDPITCWAEAHNMLGQLMPTTSIEGDPAWLQVVHGRNVSNRVLGRMVSPERFMHLFPGMLDSLPSPTAMTLLRENVVAAPARSAVNLIRTTTRKVVVRLFGRNGLNRLKNTLAAWKNVRTEAN